MSKKKSFAEGYAGGIDDANAGLVNLDLYKKGKQEQTKQEGNPK